LTGKRFQEPQTKERKIEKERLSILQRHILEEAMKIEGWIKERRHPVCLIQPDGKFHPPPGFLHPMQLELFPEYYQLDGT
jgi:hypothetical protein